MRLAKPRLPLALPVLEGNEGALLAVINALAEAVALAGLLALPPDALATAVPLGASALALPGTLALAAASVAVPPPPALLALPAAVADAQAVRVGCTDSEGTRVPALLLLGAAGEALTLGEGVAEVDCPGVCDIDGQGVGVGVALALRVESTCKDCVRWAVGREEALALLAAPSLAVAAAV